MTPPGRAMSSVAPVFSAALPARKIMDFRAGETIISQGEECTDVHYIDEGIVKLTSVSNRGRGAVLGIIKRKAMLRVLEEEPAVSMKFMNYLLLRNLRMEQNLIDHLFNSSEKRLARTLLLLARSGDGGKLPAIFDKINQDTLAEMVGTTRSRINFFMNKFRKQGFIHYNGGLKVHGSLARILEE